MSAKEIVSIAKEQGMFTDNISGQTPYQTMKSKLSVNIRRLGQDSPFLRTGPGRFFLRSLMDNPSLAYEAPPFHKPASHEKVLCVPIQRFNQICQFQGLRTQITQFYGRFQKLADCIYLERIEAETNDAYKQVVTYVLVTRRGSVLCYRRGNFSRVEDLLRGARCVGFGGHVTAADSRPLFPSIDKGVTECVIRELSEELQLPGRDIQRLQQGKGLECVGVINDDSSAVGRRHFAFVFQYEVSKDVAWHDLRRGEKSVTQLQWLNRSAQPVPIWEFEYWSQLALRVFYPHVVTTEQSYKIIRRNPLRPPHLLCVVGEVGSGKSETTGVLCREFGYAEVNTGRLLAQLLGVPPVPETPREVFQSLAWKFISSDEGPQILAAAIHRAAAETGRAKVLVDGLRQISTLENLRAQSGSRKVGVLYVYTPADIAFDFYRRREKKGVSFDDYLAVRNATVESEIPSMIGIADGVIYNWTGAKFHAMTLRRMMQDLSEW